MSLRKEKGNLSGRSVFTVESISENLVHSIHTIVPFAITQDMETKMKMVFYYEIFDLIRLYILQEGFLKGMKDITGILNVAAIEEEANKTRKEA
jgi:hypothetical protein